MKTMHFFSACIVASAVTCTTPLPRRDSMIYLLIISFTFLRGCAVFTTARKTLPKGCLLEIAHSLPRHSFFSYINNGSLPSSYFEQAEKTLQDGYVYLILTESKSASSELIGLFTNRQYNHVSLAFDRDLNTLVSYNGGE